MFDYVCEITTPPVNTYVQYQPVQTVMVVWGSCSSDLWPLLAGLVLLMSHLLKSKETQVNQIKSFHALHL